MSDIILGTIWARKFLMVLSSDHVTPYTGAASNISIQISKGPGGVGGAVAGAITAIDTTNLPGWYQVAYTVVDTGTLGELAAHATAATCDPSDFSDVVRNHTVDSFMLDSSGRIYITSQVKQNTQFFVPFIITVNGLQTPGLTGFTAQRALGNAGFAPCQNTVVEIGGAGNGGGWYGIVLPPLDTNAASIELLITNASADTRSLTIYTQP